MHELDTWVAGLGGGATLVLAIVAALLLGLRHATDPDHLAAMVSVVAGGDERGSRGAARLGLSWGAGHATTLVVLGLPIVLFSAYLPEAAASAAEALVGLVVVGLAVRLLVRWRRGLIHAHEHEHGGLRHTHPHGHRHPAGEGAGPHELTHSHAHVRPLRTLRGAYGVGLVHGVGGSAGVGVLLLAAIPDRLLGTVALTLFAAASALSMAICSGALGGVLATAPARRLAGAVLPALGALGVVFGAWYLAGALRLVPPPV